MYTSIYNSNNNNNNDNSSNSYYYTDQSMLDRSFSNDVSPGFKHPSSFFPFSPTYNGDDVPFFQHHHDFLMTHLPQHHQQSSTAGEVTNNKDANVDAAAAGGGSSSLPFDKKSTSDYQPEKIPRKRPSKKDRHSKIVTAQGPRDRRMRLSLDIARKFFTLQDMLGFDKASKTVDWLLTKSKAAIKELSRGMSQPKHSCSGSDKSVSSMSECEVVSGIDEIANNEDILRVKVSNGKPPVGITKDKRTKQTRKPTFQPLAKESRALARTRARERTIGKMLMSRSQKCQEASLHCLKQLTTLSPFEKGEESGSQNHDLKSTLDGVNEVERISHKGPVNDLAEESLTITNKANPSSIFDYSHDMAISQGANSSNFNFPSLSGNWDMDSVRTCSIYSAMINKNLSSGNIEEHIPTLFPLNTSDTSFHPQFAERQFYRSWEPYNNQGMCPR